MLNKMKKALRGILCRQESTHSEIEYLISQGLRIGKNLRNHSDHPFDALLPWLINVGDNVCISSNVKILAHDTSTEYRNGHTKIGIVEIGDNVYIGYGATILCNVRIGNNAVIGAGSVVTKDVPAGTVYAGNPAQFICTIEEFTEKHVSALDQVPVYQGPCTKWWNKSMEEKEAMSRNLQDTFGYMK